MTLKRFSVIVVPVLALALGAPGGALADFVTNGNFDLTTNGKGQLGFNTNATGWTNQTYDGTNPGYNFLYSSGSADTSGATGADGLVKLWGPGTGSNNGFPASSPNGGNYLAADGAYEIAAITQTIGNLVIGKHYTVGFYWAGAQQSGFTGPNTEGWQVTFAGKTQSTTIADNVSEGFTGWRYQLFTFTATKTTDVLSFLAVGTPVGEPPFSLLDGVSMNETVPEPTALSLFVVGILGLGAVGLRRRARSTKV